MDRLKVPAWKRAVNITVTIQGARSRGKNGRDLDLSTPGLQRDFPEGCHRAPLTEGPLSAWSPALWGHYMWLPAAPSKCIGPGSPGPRSKGLVPAGRPEQEGGGGGPQAQVDGRRVRKSGGGTRLGAVRGSRGKTGKIMSCLGQAETVVKIIQEETAGALRRHFFLLSLSPSGGGRVAKAAWGISRRPHPAPCVRMTEQLQGQSQ